MFTILNKTSVKERNCSPRLSPSTTHPRPHEHHKHIRTPKHARLIFVATRKFRTRIHTASRMLPPATHSHPPATVPPAENIRGASWVRRRNPLSPPKCLLPHYLTLSCLLRPQCLTVLTKPEHSDCRRALHGAGASAQRIQLRRAGRRVSARLSPTVTRLPFLGQDDSLQTRSSSPRGHSLPRASSLPVAHPLQATRRV